MSAQGTRGMASGGAGGMGPAMPKRDALRRYPLFVPEADDLHSAQKLAQVTECDYGLPEFWDRKYTKDAKHGMEYAFDWYTGKDHSASRRARVCAPHVARVCVLTPAACRRPRQSRRTSCPWSASTTRRASSSSAAATRASPGGCTTRVGRTSPAVTSVPSSSIR